ncbi:hypothetical protein [Thermotalea metallivorans]|uniref:Uncharacterized protein n=1 Tax=Thermotalea metallivorans TaxID=520762 RepID=A0A140LCH7_9FIRM|nr:hypothetical protein [Thermotalea metallivorans]KXG78252.1 hypothetical protein AN619_02270 [Thermotalea metallivorans]
MFINTGKYFYRSINEAREDLIGTQVVDIENNGSAIHLQDSNGREYTIDTTGEIPVVHAFSTEKERLEFLEDAIQVLIEKLNISEDELIEAMYNND